MEDAGKPPKKLDFRKRQKILKNVLTQAKLLSSVGNLASLKDSLISK